MGRLDRGRTWVTIAVLAHLIVVVVHGQAHTSLGVGLSNWQNLYVVAATALRKSFKKGVNVALL